ncbi:MAG: filamentous hemagglutinin N-terminal domain-containing protein [Leptolyngbya sp. SIO4C1]|nr:filamentous hemagglutinin N-terminal domain-containing protein [Leptolyngbya sp. SIO4C1]
MPPSQTPPPIVPDSSDAQTNTQITQTDNQYDITGGARSAGEAPNLFHRFERFNVEVNGTANFVTPADVANVINLIDSAEASTIDGLLQVTGASANLYLINPAGVIFGQTARLNLPANLVVSTADQLLFDQQALAVEDGSGYAALTGAPAAYRFTSETPATIENAGMLAVTPGQQILLMGGTVQNDGTLSARGGQVTLAAVPGEHTVRLSRTDGVLSLELDPTALNAKPLALTALPVHLTGGAIAEASEMLASAEGVQLVSAEATPAAESAQTAASFAPDLTQPGTILVRGTIDVGNQVGGEANLIGDQIVLLGANIEASGEQTGGQISMGGQPASTGLSAVYVFVDRESQLSTASSLGSGGDILIWSDDTALFYGTANTEGAVEDGTFTIDAQNRLERLAPRNRQR